MYEGFRHCACAKYHITGRKKQVPDLIHTFTYLVKKGMCTYVVIEPLEEEKIAPLLLTKCIKRQISMEVCNAVAVHLGKRLNVERFCDLTEG